MDLSVLLIVGVVLAALAMGAFFGLIFLGILTYVVKNIYPVTRKVALWASRLENFLPLLLLAVVLLLLIILIGFFAFKLPAIAALLLILVLLIILVVLVSVDILLGLGILVYVIRAVWWLYARWRGLLGDLWPPLIKSRIKHDRDKDKHWRARFAEMRKRLSDEAEEARRRISGGGE